MTVNQAEFARKAGVSPAAVGKAIKAGHLKTDSGGKLDTENAVNAEYIERKTTLRKTPRANAASARPPRSGTASGAALESGPAPIFPLASVDGEFADVVLGMTLQQLIDRFGYLGELERQTKAAATLQDLRKKKLVYQIQRGELIEFALVKNHVMGHLLAIHERIIKMPELIIGKLMNEFIKNGESARPIVLKIMQDEIADILKHADDDLRKTLNEFQPAV